MRKARREFNVILAQLVLGSAISKPAMGMERIFQSGPLRLANVELFKYGDIDATRVIQELINEGARSRREVYLEEGVFLIDASQGLELRDGSLLKLSAGTTLKAIASSSGRYAILKIYDVSSASVSGGTFAGDRSNHSGSRGQWGMGIDIRGSRNICIANATIEHCWGDGVYVGALYKGLVTIPSQFITIDTISCLYNRRQGLSLVSCDHCTITNSTFSETGGVMPGCGIDMEPNPGGYVKNVAVSNCEIYGNAGAGVQVSKNCGGITIFKCAIYNNSRYGVYLAGSGPDTLVLNNNLYGNGKAEIYVRKDAFQYVLKNNKTAGKKSVGSGLIPG